MIFDDFTLLYSLQFPQTLPIFAPPNLYPLFYLKNMYICPTVTN